MWETVMFVKILGRESPPRRVKPVPDKTHLKARFSALSGYISGMQGVWDVEVWGLGVQTPKLHQKDGRKTSHGSIKSNQIKDTTIPAGSQPQGGSDLHHILAPGCEHPDVVQARGPITDAHVSDGKGRQLSRPADHVEGLPETWHRGSGFRVWDLGFGVW